VHVLREVHKALRADGRLLDIHPLGIDFAVIAGSTGLGFVDTRDFRRVLAAMDECVAQVIREGLFEELTTRRLHVAERYDDGREALEEAESWEHLRLPAPLRRRLRETNETPVELIDTILYRLYRTS
jgi:hypothetical protein